MVALGKLILLLPQTGPWEISRAGRFLIYRQVSMEKQFLWFTKNTLPWLWTLEPKKKIITYKQTWKSTYGGTNLEIFCHYIVPLYLKSSHAFIPTPLIGINNMVAVIFSYILIVSF